MWGRHARAATAVCKKKPARGEGGRLHQVCSLLFRVDRLYRADISAGTTISAKVRIDLVDVTFANGINRALIYAGAAGSAIIRDYVSHLFGVLVNNSLSMGSQPGANLG